jgi:plastocyanin domain-containing protein
MMTIVINIVGVLLIGLIVWWFILVKPKAIKVLNNKINIKVHDGIYDPSVIEAKVGETILLSFLREDKSPCAEVVIFEKLDISSMLPLNKQREITLTINTPGEYDFTCQMGMYRGKLIVK